MSIDHGAGRVLAVDGGGAKTDLALLDPTGGLLSFVRGGRSHVHYVGIEGSIEVVKALLESAINRPGLDHLLGTGPGREARAQRGAARALGDEPRLRQRHGGA